MTYSLFRIANPDSRVGLWYDEDGTQTDFIKTLDGAQCADMPMGYDPQFKDGGSWLSAVDNLDDMRDWVSDGDIRQLASAGYSLMVYEVWDYRTINGHAAFRMEDVVGTPDALPWVAIPDYAPLEVAA